MTSERIDPSLVLGRRPVLGVGAAAAAAMLLASCGDDSTPPAAAPSGSGAATPPTDAPPSGDAAGLVKLSDVPVGGAVSAQSGGKPIIVAQPTAGQAVAFSAKCTHMGCTVAPAGAKLNCPCHGSVYDALTGKNLSGPAPAPLASFAVTVKDGEVVAG